MGSQCRSLRTNEIRLKTRFMCDDSWRNRILMGARISPDVSARWELNLIKSGSEYCHSCKSSCKPQWRGRIECDVCTTRIWKCRMLGIFQSPATLSYSENHQNFLNLHLRSGYWLWNWKLHTHLVSQQHDSRAETESQIIVLLTENISLGIENTWVGPYLYFINFCLKFVTSANVICIGPNKSLSSLAMICFHPNSTVYRCNDLFLFKRNCLSLQWLVFIQTQLCIFAMICFHHNINCYQLDEMCCYFSDGPQFRRNWR